MCILMCICVQAIMAFEEAVKTMKAGGEEGRRKATTATVDKCGKIHLNATRVVNEHHHLVVILLCKCQLNELPTVYGVVVISSLPIWVDGAKILTRLCAWGAFS